MSAAAAPTARLPATAAPGAVHLRVRDVDAEQRFYETVLGLTATQSNASDPFADAPSGSSAREPRVDPVALGAPGGEPLVVLHADPDAPRRNPHTTGLFHLAILYPSRSDLASALIRLARAGWRLDGASDHVVSEALYLSDPEGNGIELYRDRPREEWRYDPSGDIAMATLPLDLEDLLTTDPAGGRPAPGDSSTSGGAPAPPGTRMGHVHLQVANLAQADAFYNRVIGFEPTTRGYPGALFVSAGGYHHHVGLNTWQSLGAPPPAPGSAGLHHYELSVGGEESLAAVRERLAAAGREPGAETAGEILVADPSGNAVLLRP